MSATKISKSRAEWKSELSAEQYRITRDHGTEQPFSSPLNAEKRHGVFYCACCGAPLFSSEAKYDSGSGWPSFYAPASKTAVEEHDDSSLFMRRTEVRCTNCGAHLGHIFPDGPQPTGLRYCMNGVALAFKPSSDN